MSETATAEAKVFILPKAFERVDVVDLVPLPNPISLQVDPASLCNFRCAFCPTGDPHLIKSTGRGQVLMKLPLYEKIVADIERFRTPLRVLRLFKDGEPTLNPHFVDMVRIARRAKTVERIETTTNGSKLSPAFNEAIVDAGLDRIVISVEGVSAARYLAFARVRIDFDAFVANVRHLHSIRGDLKIHVKTVAQNLDFDKGEDRLFLDTFGPYADGIFIENTVSSWPDFDVDGSVPDGVDAYGRDAVRKSVCPYLFYSLSINADGVVSPCCVDWNRTLALGSVADSTIDEIWNGPALRALRRRHLVDGLATVPSCASCGQVHACTHDNFDARAADLRARLGL